MWRQSFRGAFHANWSMGNGLTRAQVAFCLPTLLKHRKKIPDNREKPTTLANYVVDLRNLISKSTVVSLLRITLLHEKPLYLALAFTTSNKSYPHSD